MNFHVPVEAMPRRRRNTFLDWRFLSALAALLFIVLLVYASWRNYNIREAEAAQKNALIEQLADRADQIRALERDVSRLSDHIILLQDRASEDRREASRERQRLLEQQALMLRILRRADLVSNTATAPTAGPEHAPASDDARPRERRPSEPAPDPEPKEPSHPNKPGKPKGPAAPPEEPPAPPPPVAPEPPEPTCVLFLCLA